MLDAPLKPEKHLTAEEVGRLVGRDERLVQQMYRAHLIDAAELRRGKVVFSPTEAHRWKKWYLECAGDLEKYLWASDSPDSSPPAPWTTFSASSGDCRRGCNRAFPVGYPSPRFRP